MEPLSNVLRPTTLDQFVGQEHLVGEDGPLRKVILSDRLASMVWHGPSGTGKTTLARIISKVTNSNFVEINATMSNTKAVKLTIEDAKIRKTLEKKDTIIYIDEIHRFNKTQLDLLLPHVESGSIILICSTTQNPFFCLVPALVSRLNLFEFKTLSEKDLIKILIGGVRYYREYQNKTVKLTRDAVKHFVSMSSGDARKILSMLEFSVSVIDGDNVDIDLAVCMRIAPNKHVLFDKSGDAHFSYMSAIQGAIQASDVHGALFYLAKTINSKEKIEVICRRLLVTASEDVGCCNPMAAVHTYSCVKSAIMVGFPEASIILASAVAYLAMQPRSKAAYSAISKAMKIDQEHNVTIPDQLKDCHYEGAKELGRGSYQDGHNIDEYIRILDDLFVPENGDEIELMTENKKLWSGRN